MSNATCTQTSNAVTKSDPGVGTAAAAMTLGRRSASLGASSVNNLEGVWTSLNLAQGKVLQVLH